MNRKNFIATAALGAIGLSAFSKTVLSQPGGCETTNDILGPFYRPKAPHRNNLLFKGLKGAELTITGRVQAENCFIPVKGALIEIWHCDTEGNYDNTSSAFLHRASLLSDENGDYQFKTILPGKYLNGKLYRPTHIHFRVTAPDQKELVTQIYFKDDENIMKDPWASKPEAYARTLPLAPIGNRGGLAVRFPIYMTK